MGGKKCTKEKRLRKNVSNFKTISCSWSDPTQEFSLFISLNHQIPGATPFLNFAITLTYMTRRPHTFEITIYTRHVSGWDLLISCLPPRPNYAKKRKEKQQPTPASCLLEEHSTKLWFPNSEKWRNGGSAARPSSGDPSLLKHLHQRATHRRWGDQYLLTIRVEQGENYRGSISYLSITGLALDAPGHHWLIPMAPVLQGTSID